MKTTLFWISTGLLAAVLLLGGVMDVLRAPPVVQTITALGYPAYVATLLGVWKVLGAAAIAAPGLPRLKEWAYAGVVFDLSGATVSHLVSGSPAFHPVITTTLLVVAGLSWATRPASRRLTAPVAPQRESVPA